MDEEQDDLFDQDDQDADPADDGVGGLTGFEREDGPKPTVDYAAMSKAEFEAVVAAAKGGGQAVEGDLSFGPEGLEAVARLNEVMSSPDSTPEMIRAAAPADPVPEIAGYLQPADLAILGIHTNQPVPITKEASAAAAPWIAMLQDTARQAADARAAEWAKQAGEAPDNLKPVDYDSLSAEAILALGEAARTGMRPKIGGQPLTADIVNRALGDEW